MSITPAGMASSVFAATKKTLNKFINDVRGHGATGLDIKLPRIAFIGNQSAGKSSLIEAISGVSVSRASGTATKCPMEVRMASCDTDRPWSCQISLRREYDDETQESIQHAETKFGTLILDPNEVESALRRAQLSILNPSINSNDFVAFDLAKLEFENNDGPPLGSSKQYSFSSNVVVIDIVGPQVTDLTFVDLPGIISNAPRDQLANIDLIRNMCKAYIKDNTFIVLTLTMKDDIENQSCATLAKEFDPDGLRTVGVLTKADVIEPGDHARWIKILKGESHALKYGYFVTRQSNELERVANMSRDKVTQLELDFFRDNDPWPTLGPKYRARFGVKNLTDFLSERLCEYISEKMPDIMRAITEATENVNHDLRDLPPAPSLEPSIELNSICSAFARDLDHFAQGSPQFEGLIQRMNVVFSDFKRLVHSTAPQFTPFEKQAILDQSAKVKAYVEPAFLGTHSTATTDADEISQVLALDLNDIRELILQSKTRELPLNVPYAAKASLMRKSLSSWPLLVTQCLDLTRPLVLAIIAELVKKHFRRSNNKKLSIIALSTVNKEIDALFEGTSKRLEWIVSLDVDPYTQNYDYYLNIQERLLVHYQGSRRTETVRHMSLGTLAGAVLTSKVFGLAQRLTSYTANAVAALVNCGYQVTSADLPRLLKGDEYSQELDVMSQTRAFFEVAYKRIIDNIPRAIDHDIIQAMSKRAHDALVRDFDVSAEGGAAKARLLLAESAAESLYRSGLEAKKKSLEAIRKSVTEFAASAY